MGAHYLNGLLIFHVSKEEEIDCLIVMNDNGEFKGLLSINEAQKRKNPHEFYICSTSIYLS